MTTASLADLDTGITLGSTGQQARWTLSPWGAVIGWGQQNPVPLDWHVAADDRWHVPAQDSTVRQQRIDGTPVVETRIRVPDGDAVQRVWAVSDIGGAVIVEFENDSPKPFAIALTGPAVVSERPPADVPIRGIDLPGEAILLPVGHRSTVRVALPSRRGTFPSAALTRVPPALAVVRGWTRVAEQASRLVLPDVRLVEAIVAARCDLLLEGPVDAGDDPVGFLLDVSELVRCGDTADAWLTEIVEPAERVARLATRRSGSADEVASALQGLAAAHVVARRAGDERASGDIERTVGRVVQKRSDVDVSAGVAASFAGLRRSSSVGRFVRAVERRIVDRGRILTGGMPTTWLGTNFEVHGLPTSSSTAVSFAIRWHGERPAVLWEQQGDVPVELSAPDLDAEWRTAERSGEALWPGPTVERSPRTGLRLTIDPDDDTSFV